VDTDPHEHVEPDAFESRARSALTLGVLSLVLGFLTGIPAIWLGGKALRYIGAAEGALRGRWAAYVGIILGCLGTAMTVVAWTYLHTR
jgi:hypothetical protein